MWQRHAERSLTPPSHSVYDGSVKAAIYKTRGRLAALVALVVVSLLLAASQRVGDLACYRVHCRAAPRRHSALTGQAGRGADGWWLPEPPSNDELAFFRTRELSTNVVRRILRLHRIAFVPIAIHRLKLPLSNTDPF